MPHNSAENDEIMDSYTKLADTIGPDVLKQLIPPDEKRNTDTNQSSPNPFVHFFNILLIKLLAAATLGPESLNISNAFYSVGEFYDQSWPVVSG